MPLKSKLTVVGSIDDENVSSLLHSVVQSRLCATHLIKQLLNVVLVALLQCAGGADVGSRYLSHRSDVQSRGLPLALVSLERNPFSWRVKSKNIVKTSLPSIQRDS